MAYSRKTFTVGALGVAAFALIGTGATATFTDGVQAKQLITAGTMNMTITSGEPGAWRTADGKKLTLKPVGPVSSDFSTGPQNIIISNSSNIDAKMVRLVVTAPTSNKELKDGIYVKIQMGTEKTTVYNGLLTELPSDNNLASTGQTIAAGSAISAHVTFYAGRDDMPSLPNGAQGGVVVPTFAISFNG